MRRLQFSASKHLKRFATNLINLYFSGVFREMNILARQLY